MFSVILLTCSPTCAFVKTLDCSVNRRHIVIRGWSRIAELDEDGVATCLDCQALGTRNPRGYDLSSPRQWLEFLEEKDGEGGAYTVLRCDYNKNSWNIWGPDFHMNRLRKSYCTLEPVDKDALDDAVASTNVILNTLLNETSSFVNSSNFNSTYTFMLTLLWQRGRESSRILVRGHACWNGKPSRLDEYNPEPISAILALSSNHEQLPNRYKNNPESKLSAWCRQRRQLEETFCGTGEILLTRPVGEDVHILEGLTSNVFFIYPNNKLRTADDGVLKGYARKLVMDCAKSCGLDYDPAPIRVQDAQMWHEVFLTSSLRLIVPIAKVFIPDEESDEIHKLWSKRHYSPRWRLLYQEMLKCDSSFVTRSNSLNSPAT